MTDQFPSYAPVYPTLKVGVKNRKYYEGKMCISANPSTVCPVFTTLFCPSTVKPHIHSSQTCERSFTSWWCPVKIFRRLESHQSVKWHARFANEPISEGIIQSDVLRVYSKTRKHKTFTYGTLYSRVAVRIQSRWSRLSWISGRLTLTADQPSFTVTQ